MFLQIRVPEGLGFPGICKGYTTIRSFGAGGIGLALRTFLRCDECFTNVSERLFRIRSAPMSHPGNASRHCDLQPHNECLRSLCLVLKGLCPYVFIEKLELISRKSGFPTYMVISMSRGPRI